MKADPIVEEVRGIRLQLEAEARQDGEQLYRRLRALQDTLSERLVAHQPKRLTVPVAEGVQPG